MLYKIIFTLGFLLFFNQNSNNKDIHNLKAKIENKFAHMDGEFALAFKNLSNTKQRILINEDESFHAASTMKTPVMIELFKQVHEEKFKLSDSILVKNEFKSIVDGSLYQMDIGDDSGDALYQMIGKKETLNDLMVEMITVSSNLATNILIDLVNAEKVTQSMRKLGAKKIEVLRGVEDIKAYDKGLSNSTTAKDLMIILQAIAENKAGTKKDCTKMVEILKNQEFNNMIPKYLPKNVKVAHKTGSITGVHHDSGIVYLPNGEVYILVILSKNLKDFDQATDEMAKISKMIYDFVSRQED